MRKLSLLAVLLGTMAWIAPAFAADAPPSGSSGAFPPHISTEQRLAIVSPTKGLWIYDTTLNELVYWNGSSWIAPNGDVSGFAVLTRHAREELKLAEIDANQVYAAAFGAICDGQPHPLSSITSYAGVNSTGRTLADWQVFFPEAQSLADEIDGLAWSAAFRAAQVDRFGYRLVFAGKKGGKCRSTGGVNLTNGVIKNAFLDFRGTNLFCSGHNAVCLDFTATKFATIISPWQSGDCNVDNEPYSGFRALRYAQGQYTGSLTVLNPVGDGCYTHATREWSDEVSLVVEPLENNQDVNGGRALYIDAQNQFDANATARFYPITVPVNSGNAITQYTQIMGNEVCNTCDGPIYINGGFKPQFIGTYTNNNNPVPGHKYGVIVYITLSVPLNSPNFDMRSESFGAAGTSGEFYITGDDPTPILTEWKYRTFSDWSCVAQNNLPGCGVFVLDPAIASATFVNLDFSTSVFANQRVPPVFAQPEKWNGSGHISVPWPENMPLLGGHFTGTLCFGGSTPVCNTTTPTESLLLGGDFIEDTPWEHTLMGTTKPGAFGPLSNTWRLAVDGTTNSKATYQNQLGFGCQGAFYDQVMTVASGQAMAPGDGLGVFTEIPATDLQQLRWGKGGAALPMVFDLCLKSNVTGNIALDLSNVNQNEHYLHTIQLPPVPDTYKEYIFRIDPWTRPTKFGNAPNLVGMRVGLVYGCGSNFQNAKPAFTASISATTMDVTDILGGAVVVGDVLTGAGVTGGTSVVAQLTGDPGGIGTYQVSASQTVISETIFGTTPQPILPEKWTDTTGAIGALACLTETSNLLATTGNTVSVSYIRALPGSYWEPPLAKSEVRRVAEATRYYQKSIPANVAPDATNGYKNAGLLGAYTFNASANLGAAFTASASGTTLTVASVESGVIYRGMIIDGVRFAPGNHIKDQVSGTPGGAGVYTLFNGAGTVDPGASVTGQLGATRIKFKSPMASNLTQFSIVSIFSPLAVSNNCWDLTANVDGGLGEASNVTDEGFTLTCWGAIAGRTYGAHWTAVAPM